MTTATEERTDDETAEAESQRRYAHLAARINEADPAAEADAELVEGWSDDERAAVVAVLDDPPETIDGIPEGFPAWFDEAAYHRLAFGALRKRLDNALRRADRVKKAERRLADEKANLHDIDDQIEDLKKQRKGAESRVEAAVFALQRAVTDSEIGQNVLSFGDPEDEPPAADPAKTAPISDLGLSLSLTEKLIEAEVIHVGDLIDRINADDLWHRKIKGVGEKRIDDITDALNRWRQEHPAPAE